MKPRFPGLIRKLKAVDGGRFDAYELAADGCRIFFASYPAGTEIEEHTHDTENVGVITAGELILITAAGEQRYRTGDWYHLAANEPHAARFEQDTVEVEFWFERHE